MGSAYRHQQRVRGGARAADARIRTPERRRVAREELLAQVQASKNW